MIQPNIRRFCNIHQIKFKTLINKTYDLSIKFHKASSSSDNSVYLNNNITSSLITQTNDIININKELDYQFISLDNLKNYQNENEIRRFNKELQYSFYFLVENNIIDNIESFYFLYLRHYLSNRDYYNCSKSKEDKLGLILCYSMFLCLSNTNTSISFISFIKEYYIKALREGIVSTSNIDYSNRIHLFNKLYNFQKVNELIEVDKVMPEAKRIISKVHKNIIQLLILEG